MIITLSGELDLAHTGRIETTIRRAVGCGPNAVVVDIAAVEFMDSVAISTLLRMYQLADDARVHLTVEGASGQVRRILDAAGLLGVPPFVVSAVA